MHITLFIITYYNFIIYTLLLFIIIIVQNKIIETRYFSK